MGYIGVITVRSTAGRLQQAAKASHWRLLLTNALARCPFIVRFTCRSQDVPGFRQSSEAVPVKAPAQCSKHCNASQNFPVDFPRFCIFGA